jgi:hypothetical protein
MHSTDRNSVMIYSILLPKISVWMPLVSHLISIGSVLSSNEALAKF